MAIEKVNKTTPNRQMPSPMAAVSFNSAMASPSPMRQSKIKTPNSVTFQQTTHNHSQISSAFTPFQPLLTPGYTPRGSQAGMVLLSPGRTITESLNALASSTAQQLEKIWDEVGYTPQERAAQLSDLIVKFRDQCELKISEEQAVADTFRQTIMESKEELKALGAALNAPIDPRLLRENVDQTLTDELSNLQDSLEILRDDAAIAKQDLQECLEFLEESHGALGRPLNETWKDIESDLTIRRREEFRRQVEEMKEEISTRTGAIVQLLRDCQHLMKDLGIDGEQSESALDRRIHGSLVRSNDSNVALASEFQTETSTGISAKALEELTTRASELSHEKKKRKTMLQEMGAEIAILWEQLRIPEEDQRIFTDSVKGLGMDTIHKGQNELQRLKTLKANMMGKLIDEARQVIRDLWEETNASEAMREAFTPMAVEEDRLFNDNLFEQHEEHIQELQERLEHMKPIIRLIERREDILRERVEYEELQKDSDRLKQRGAAMARQLMEEEKMARRIKKDLPKMTASLQEKLAEWQQWTGEEFKYQGRVYSEVMMRQEDEWVQYKATEMQMKLKKKQEEHHSEENKFLVKANLPKRKPSNMRPLGDSNRVGHGESDRPPSRLRGRNTTEMPQKPSPPVRGTSRSRLTT